MISSVSFSEFIAVKNAEHSKKYETDGETWTDAFRVFSKASHPVNDVRSLDEWENLFNEMVNSPIKD